MRRQTPPGWRALRRRVLIRDQARCSHCSAREPDVELHAHHVVPKERGGADEITNLITLCEFCHYETHGHINSHKEISETDLPRDPSEKLIGKLRRVEQLEKALKEKRSELSLVREENKRLSDHVERLEKEIAPDDDPPLVLHESENTSRSDADARTRAFDQAGVLKTLKWRVFGMPEDADE